MSDINLYPNDLRMPETRATPSWDSSYCNIYCNIYCSIETYYTLDICNMIPNRPYGINTQELFYSMIIDKYGYFTSDFYIYEIDYSCANEGYMRQGTHFFSALDGCGYYPWMIAYVFNDYYGESYNSYFNNIYFDSYGEYLIFSAIGQYGYNYYNSFSIELGAQIDTNFINPRNTIYKRRKFINYEIDIGSILVGQETLITYEKLFELLKPKILEKYDQLFYDNINDYSSTLFDYYEYDLYCSTNEPYLYYDLYNKAFKDGLKPNINVSSFFYRAFIDFPFYSYPNDFEINLDYSSSGRFVSTSFEYSNMLYIEYSGNIYLCDPPYNNEELILYSAMYYKPIYNYCEIRCEYDFCSSGVGTSGRLRVDQNGLNIHVDEEIEGKFLLGTIASFYLPSRNSDYEELDTNILISFRSGFDFEPEEKEIITNLFETSYINIKEIYGNNYKYLELVSDDENVKISKGEDSSGVYYGFTAMKSGTYTVSQYVNGILKSNKIIINVLNNVILDVSENIKSLMFSRISFNDICPSVPNNINININYNEDELELIQEGRILLIKPKYVDLTNSTIEYSINDVDKANITLNILENDIQSLNINDTFLILEKDNNRRIYSNFSDYIRYNSKIKDGKLYRINSVDDFLNYNSLIEKNTSIVKSDDIKLVINNNKITIKNIENVLYSSSKYENGNTIVIDIIDRSTNKSLSTNVVFFDKILKNTYFDRTEYYKYKKYFNSIEFIDYDNESVFNLISEEHTNKNCLVKIFILNENNDIQMWEYSSYTSNNVVPDYCSENFNINSIEDSINKLGISFYKSADAFGLNYIDNKLINSININLSSSNNNPYLNLDTLLENGKNVIVANSENHKSVYSKFIEKNKKYSITDLKKPSNFRVTTYDMNDSKIGEFSIQSNGNGDYKIKDTLFTSHKDIEDVELSFCIEGTSIVSKTYECYDKEIKCNSNSYYDLVLYKNILDSKPLLSKNDKLNISKIEEDNNKIIYRIYPLDNSIDTITTISVSDNNYSDSINVEFKNIVYKYRPTNKSELQTLLFNTTPRPNLYEIDTSLIADMSYLFQDRNGYDFVGIEYWDVSNVTNMSYMFYNCQNFNQNINNWNVSNVTNMCEIFYYCYNFNQPLNNWDVSNVTNMSYMFYNCQNFNQNINNWNVSNVTNMSYMFYGCYNFNKPLNDWDVSKVTNMYQMFYYCFNFNQPLNNWTISKITNMQYMFSECYNFNQDISNWNVSNVTNMYRTFYNCYNFNQDISNWNVSNVTDMQYMFYNCYNFNQDISNWNVSKVASYNNIFYGTKLENNKKPLKFI